MSKKLLEDLEQLYSRLDSTFPTYEGNFCGDCRACCTAEGLTRHNVGSIELSNIRRHLGAEKAEAFRQYTSHEKDTDGRFLHDQCPFYDTATRGCGIYTFRPFSCRIFGHYRAQDSTLPKGCVFHGREKTFALKDYAASVPFARDLRGLMRMHIATQDALPIRYVSPAEVAANLPGASELEDLTEAGDLYDRAMVHQLKREYAEAMRLLAQAWKEQGDVPYLVASIGMTFELMGQHAEAISAYTRAVELLPDSSTLHYHLGYNALSIGDRQRALIHLVKTVELNPEHSLALGFLGYLHIISGDPQTGANYLEAASALDPANGFFQLRLGLAWLSLGRAEEGLERIARAVDFEPTREQARQILATQPPPSAGG